MTKTVFPTPLFLQLWERSGQLRAALTLLTLASPFDARPEWILPHLSDVGIDFTGLSVAFPTQEQNALVASAAWLYGYDMGNGPVTVRLGEVVAAISTSNVEVLKCAIRLAAATQAERTHPRPRRSGSSHSARKRSRRC